MPWRFLAAVSLFGTGVTGYLTWSKVTSNPVACPVSGCSTILNSPYAWIGPVPLSALGALGYGVVATASLLALYLKPQRGAARNMIPQRSEALQVVQQTVLYSSGVLAGTSAALAATIAAKFSGEWCLFCAASILASTALYAGAYAGSHRVRAYTPDAPQPRWSFGAFAGATLAVTALFASYPDVVTAGGFELPYESQTVTARSPPGAASLAERLRARGAAMYGAFWCTHCAAQKEAFGADAQAALPYVECYPGGYRGAGSIAPACADAGIKGFPTWIINGAAIEGDWPLPYLEAVLDGADPRAEAKKYGS